MNTDSFAFLNQLPINIDGLHIFSVYFMTGVIWIIQVVHYPLMSKVHPDFFAEFHLEHSNKITYVVGPTMILQLATSFWVSQFNYLWLGLSLANFALTFLVSVPIHNKLATTWNPELHKKLVFTNWPRTLLWSAHSLLLYFVFFNS
jgi:hypothetical protein